MRIKPTRSARLLSLALTGGLLGVTGFVLADFNSKDVRKGGMTAGDGVHNGGGLGADKSKVQDAINKLKGNAGGASDACEKGLQDMLDKHRICKENGTSGNGATTLPDGKEGLGADGINVNPSSLNADPEVLACMLAHEWVHVNQKGPPPYDEIEAYAAEKKCLEDLGKAGSARHKQMSCCLDSLKGVKKKAVEVPRSRSGRVSGLVGPDAREAIIAPAPIQPFLPYTGFADLILGSSVFMVNEAELGLQSYPINSLGGFNVYPLNMQKPLNLLRLPGKTGPSGGPILAISGATGADGIVDFVEVDSTNGLGVQTLGSVFIPGTHPISLAFEVYQGLALLYVLDNKNKQILLFLDGDGDGLPELSTGTPWATAAAFPALNTAKAITHNTAASLSVLGYSHDRRIEGTVQLSKAAFSLHDTNVDGVAETTRSFFEYELVAIIPWPLPPLAAGDTQLTAFCTAGDKIELWSSNAAGAELSFLGSQLCGTDNEAAYTLASPLASGDYLLLKDITYLFADPPVPFQVP